MIKKCKHCMGEHQHDKMTNDISIHFGDDAIFCPFCGRCLEKSDYHKKEKPTITDRDTAWSGETEESHPAYAQLQISRQSGGHLNLYGSAIKHQETISLRIYRSVKHISKYSEHYYADNAPLVEIRMSQSQFAEAITTMNMGSGTPVTLESMRGQQFPKCEEMTINERANAGLNNKLNDFADMISVGQEEVHDILNKKGAINKKERKTIANIYNMLMQDLRDNIPFLHECMIEAYDKTAQSAKADIEAFYVNSINRMGVEAIKQQQIKYKVNNSDRLYFDNDTIEEAEIVEDK